MEVENKSYHKNKIHRVLAHSYTTYFVLFLIGIIFDSLFKIKVFSNSIVVPIGFIILVLATFLVVWAQKTSRDLRKENLSKDNFYKGPYCYTRSPTHWGLFFLMLGFGIITNSIFVILFTLFAFFVSRFIFLEKEEKLLSEKYGTPYLEYKKSVRK